MQAAILATIEERNLVPSGLIEEAATVALLIIAAGVVYKYTVWSRSIPPGFFKDTRKYLGSASMVRLLFSELANRVAMQKDVITDSRVRRVTHMMVFWGFLGLAFATTWTFIFYRDGTPRPLDDPGKIVGNIGGALVIAGCSVILFRYVLFEKYRRGAQWDFAFFSMLFLSTITGFLSEFARLTADAPTLYAIYVIHLAFISGLLLTAPFTHFLHALLVPFERYVGRLQTAVIARSALPYPDYRKAAMVQLAADIKMQEKRPVYPEWLRKKKESHEG